MIELHHPLPSTDMQLAHHDTLMLEERRALEACLHCMDKEVLGAVVGSPFEPNDDVRVGTGQSA